MVMKMINAWWRWLTQWSWSLPLVYSIKMSTSNHFVLSRWIYGTETFLVSAIDCVSDIDGTQWSVRAAMWLALKWIACQGIWCWWRDRIQQESRNSRTVSGIRGHSDITGANQSTAAMSAVCWRLSAVLYHCSVTVSHKTPTLSVHIWYVWNTCTGPMGPLVVIWRVQFDPFQKRNLELKVISVSAKAFRAYIRLKFHCHFCLNSVILFQLWRI